MEVAYVAGPYRAATPWEVKQNICRAEKVAAELWKMGYAVICQHAGTAFFDGVVPDEVFLEGDLAILERCDLVVMLPGWESSQGARKEFERAVECGIRVVQWTEDGVLRELAWGSAGAGAPSYAEGEGTEYADVSRSH